MKTVNNPFNENEKVLCLHYYEHVNMSRTLFWICIFVFNDNIYLYRVDYDCHHASTKTSIVDFGFVEPKNMTKAIATFKNHII